LDDKAVDTVEEHNIGRLKLSLLLEDTTEAAETAVAVVLEAGMAI
jgi:hypothetical protein